MQFPGSWTGTRNGGEGGNCHLSVFQGFFIQSKANLRSEIATNMKFWRGEAYIEYRLGRETLMASEASFLCRHTKYGSLANGGFYCEIIPLHLLEVSFTRGKKPALKSSSICTQKWFLLLRDRSRPSPRCFLNEFLKGRSLH